MKHKIKLKSVISLLLSFAMLMSVVPMTTFAAQSNEYVDPADNWLNSNGRTNELDVNATTTYETQYCCVCDKTTTVLTYRVPEYTRTGETAANRGVRFSDGANYDGSNYGNLDDGTPGVDAYYTSYHWTKSVCQVCGTINTVNGLDSYDFNNNIYVLNACDHNFFIDFDATTYDQYDEDYHITSLKRGKYCQYCKGTTARATTGLEYHDFSESVDAQLSNNRFYTTEKCYDCGYESSEYVTAKSVISSYYGTEDGDAHTVTVSDLSESGVKTSIRYGTSAENCNKTSAPNYTAAGYYPIYYKITYSYAGEEMTENGVSYVWLLEDDSDENNGNNTIIVVPPAHEHDLRYLETVAPSCENLGYERWQCDGCGELQKMNYTPAVGHDYEDVTIREATCKQGGLKLTLCKNCGDFHQTTTAKGEHNYESHKHNATCRSVGFTEHICSVCGDNYITDMTALISHAYEHITKEPDCVNGGYTTSTCTMCGSSYVSNHTDPLGHDWDEGTSVTSSTCTSEGVIEHKCKNCDEKMIIAENATGHTPGAEATCTEPQICTVCETVLAVPTGHNHTVKITEPTCTVMGFSTYTCECGDTYTTDFVDKIDHDFAEEIVAPTCTSMGHTEFSCINCDAEYIGNFVDKLPHDYTAEVKNPTCSEFGHTKYTCSCGDSYIGDYTDKLEHNYNKQVVEPTCEEHGYAIYECPDCGASYIGDYVENKEHSYVEVKTPATCTEMGYSTFTCECGESYIGNYVDKLPHSYESVITAPTCTTLGYTTKTCTECGDTLKVDYAEPTGHTPSDWIIDIPATITSSGSKHTECTVCGEKLQTAEIAQLVDSDRTDEDGAAEIGDFSIILTDKDGVPVFNSEIVIDVDDKISIKLPSGRLLDFADQTTITAFYTENQKPASDLSIFIEDLNGNNATGKTDANGQLKVPNNQSSTGDDNGTIGNETEDNKNTYVVSVTDKFNVKIPNCDVKIGESNNVVIDLPDGLILTKESPVIVTITDHNGNPQKNVSVIVIADKDYIEKGVTDKYGKLTVPPVNSGYTDADGKVHISGFNVIVEDETKKIENAYVTYNEDNTISVLLPSENLIDYSNRICVTVLDKDGAPVKDITVKVIDVTENNRSGITDENGKMVVPPLSEDKTDKEGKATVNGFNVLITDEKAVIENAFVTMTDGKINIELPGENVIDVNNRIIVTVTDTEEKPVKDMSVTVKDNTGRVETNLTDADGKAIVPPTTFDITDVNGYGELNEYSITVADETKPIEKAEITLNEDKSVSVVLPVDTLILHSNRITVTIKLKADNTPVKDVTVNVSEAAKIETDDADNTETNPEVTEPKTVSGKTDENGMVVVPPLSEDITDGDGNSDITDKDEKPGEDTDGDGTEDKPGEIITTKYNVALSDTKGNIPNALVKIEDGKVFITIPDSHVLDVSNQITATVTDTEGKPVANVSVTMTDKNNTSKTGTTNTNGKVTLPVKTSSGGSSGGSSYSGGGGGGGSYSSTTITVVDKDNKSVSVSKSTSTTKATLTLPTGKKLTDDNYYTITVKSSGKAKADYEVVLKDRSGNEVTGKTDANGVVMLPGKKHSAYIFGYPDSTFRPDGNMTRGEASAIFARLIAEEKGEKISGTSTSFKDVSKNEWCVSYISYLEKYDIIKGYSDKTFRPDDFVSRAEFVAMTVRFYDLFNDVTYGTTTTKYTDVPSNYWAIKEIAYAKNTGWLNGYADGTFRGDNNITRAEVVAVVNRATGRSADEDYINKNFTKLNRFTDVNDSSKWYFADINEAANEHIGITTSEGETWTK